MNGVTERKFIYGDEGFMATKEFLIFLDFAINGTSVLSSSIQFYHQLQGRGRDRERNGVKL